MKQLWLLKMEHFFKQKNIHMKWLIQEETTMAGFSTDNVAKFFELIKSPKFLINLLSKNYFLRQTPSEAPSALRFSSQEMQLTIQVQILDETVSIFLSANVLPKGIHLSILPPQVWVDSRVD